MEGWGGVGLGAFTILLANQIGFDQGGKSQAFPHIIQRESYREAVNSMLKKFLTSKIDYSSIGHDFLCTQIGMLKTVTTVV